MSQHLSGRVIDKLLVCSEFRFEVGATQMSPTERIARLRQLAAELTTWADSLDEFFTAVATADREHRERRRKIAEDEANFFDSIAVTERARRERLRGGN